MQCRHQLSPEEKALVCNVYDYFVAEAKEGRSGGRNSRQQTKEATRFGKNTIFRVLRARNINPNTDFVEVRLPFSPIRVLKIERKYMTALEECELVDDEELCVGDEDDAE
ncbi:hypothetical protein GQ600_20009 [Phytophthora cactorum]|nr:hypothetical protein GQ600_20009 [Phytophthora cactorum]